MPWATWYENTSGGAFGSNNIFASRFDATQNKWVFAGQGRGLGGAAGVQVPSLNIHTNQDAENPSVAGGTTTPGGNPGPWITWQETSRRRRAPRPDLRVAAARPRPDRLHQCHPGRQHAGAARRVLLAGDWGRPRGSGDPSLNVDPVRDGIEPDIAFTGSGDNVPWVVWYETGAPGTGLQGPNGMVFAAKGVAANAPAEGGLAWTAVGNGAQGALDASVERDGHVRALDHRGEGVLAERRPDRRR